jgi:hypothetical protein
VADELERRRRKERRLVGINSDNRRQPDKHFYCRWVLKRLGLRMEN